MDSVYKLTGDNRTLLSAAWPAKAVKKLHYFRVKRGETQKATFLLGATLNVVQMGRSALSPLDLMHYHFVLTDKLHLLPEHVCFVTTDIEQRRSRMDRVMSVIPFKTFSAECVFSVVILYLRANA